MDELRRRVVQRIEPCRPDIVPAVANLRALRSICWNMGQDQHQGVGGFAEVFCPSPHVGDARSGDMRHQVDVNVEIVINSMLKAIPWPRPTTSRVIARTPVVWQECIFRLRELRARVVRAQRNEDTEVEAAVATVVKCWRRACHYSNCMQARPAGAGAVMGAEGKHTQAPRGDSFNTHPALWAERQGFPSHVSGMWAVNRQTCDSTAQSAPASNFLEGVPRTLPPLSSVGPQGA